MTDIQLIRIDLNDRYENGQSKRKPSKERDKQQQNMTLWTIIIWSQVDRIELIFFPDCFGRQVFSDNLIETIWSLTVWHYFFFSHSIIVLNI